MADKTPKVEDSDLVDIVREVHEGSILSKLGMTAHEFFQLVAGMAQIMQGQNGETIVQGLVNDDYDDPDTRQKILDLAKRMAELFSNGLTNDRVQNIVGGIESHEQARSSLDAIFKRIKLFFEAFPLNEKSQEEIARYLSGEGASSVTFSLLDTTYTVSIPTHIPDLQFNRAIAMMDQLTSIAGNFTQTPKRPTH